MSISAVTAKPSISLSPTQDPCCHIHDWANKMATQLDSSYFGKNLNILIGHIQKYLFDCCVFWIGTDSFPQFFIYPAPVTTITPSRITSQTIPSPLPECHHCKPRVLSEEEALKKMIKNAKKAVEEHRKKAGYDINAFATPAEALPSIASLNAPVTSPLQLQHAFADNIGRSRRTMQDAHTYVDLGRGALTMICDGHGSDSNGHEVSRYVVENFERRFPEALTKAHGNVHKAFETLIHEIHHEIAQKREWDNVGSTAVICYIDKHTHKIYTASLGDSEANLFRNFPSGMKSIPLSVVRDWSSPKDAARAAKALDKPIIAHTWPNREAKLLRFDPDPTLQALGYGVNVSRAIGDVHCAGRSTAPGVVHKAKISVSQAKAGDILILACDGLRDYAGRIVDRRGMAIDSKNPELRIRDKVGEKAAGSAQAIADSLVQLGLGGMTDHAGDNITVVAIKIS